LDQVSEDHEQHFLKVFIGVFVALTVFTLFCVVVARSLAPASDTSDDTILNAALQSRISPVGSVNTGEVEEAAAPVQVAAQSPADLVAGNCAACHASGVAGAPKTDDAAAWEQRREAGLDALVASVINGKGAMPPRAGTSLDDDQLRAAVQHLAGFETDGAGADAEPATDAAATDTAAPETTPETTPETATAETAEAGSAMVAGALTDKIKSTVDGLCLGCHLAGVAGAPKIGDAKAWDERAEKGLAGMVSVVSSGKGAMPPRGGSDLTDDELGPAIEYLMSK